MRTLVLASLCLTIPTLAAAAEPSPEPLVKFEEIAIDYEISVAEGAAGYQPEGSICLARKRTTFTSLIQTREAWVTELLRSLER